MKMKSLGAWLLMLGCLFSSAAAKDNEVIVFGWDVAEVQQMVTDFTAMNRKQMGPKFQLLVTPRPNHIVRIDVPDDCPPVLFEWLVNYLRYPKGFDPGNRRILVLGKAILTKDFTLPEQSIPGAVAFFYVPADDKTYDTVYVRVGSATFEASFTSSTWRRVADPRLPLGIVFLMHDAVDHPSNG